MKKIINKFKSIFADKDSRRVFIAIIAILLALGAYIYILKSENRVQIENSLINTPVITISPDQPGKIMEWYVTNGNSVKKGDLLALVGTQKLKAYTDGLVTAVNNQRGSIASSQTPVVQMIDLSSMRVDGTIDENKGLNQIKVGQIASFTVDALPGNTYWGYIDEVSPSAKQTQLAFSISSTRPTQQFDIFVKFDSYSHPEIKNGMSAKITVYTK
jgi:multidrug resistance efflux pump